LVNHKASGSFRAEKRNAKLAIKTLEPVELCNKDDGFIELEGNGFLKHMIRSFIGILVYGGKNKYPATSHLIKILAERNRKTADPTAPAEGLCLIKSGW